MLVTSRACLNLRAFGRKLIFLLLCNQLVVTAIPGQTPRAPTDADYRRAEKFLLWNAAAQVLNATGSANWLPDNKFWYSRTTAAGHDFVLVDPAHRTREVCDLARAECSKAERIGPNASLSPDKRRMAFIRDDNLWVRDLGSAEEFQLTADGSKDFGYATDNPGWEHTGRPVLRWSPDSKRIATYQDDQRKVGEMYLVATSTGHPKLDTWKYAMPGDQVIPMIHRVIIDVDNRRVVRLRMPADPYRASHCYDLECGDGELTDTQWSPDSQRLAFISTSRDHQTTTLRIADARTGAVRDILEEKVKTFYYSATSWRESAVNWRYLWQTEEVIWFSQRDNWGHLYLFDATNAKIKQQITRGNWNVIDLIHVDERNRRLYLAGVGHEAGRNPYFAHFYSVGMDGRNLRLLTPEDAHHVISMAPAGGYFVDRYSRPDAPPVAVLRNSDGRLLRLLERAAIPALEAAGWRPPVQITVKARDGRTDLYGLMFKPTNFDSQRKYPVIDCIYPGPQVGSASNYAFFGAAIAEVCDARSLAELGFIVVAIDGMGTPMRSKAFQDTYYGNMADNTLPDQIAALQQLAARNPWIDLDRVGITGASGGGYATADAMFRYPDFFKVGVSECGNHDNGSYEGDWGEEFQGLLQRTPDGLSNYDSQANQAVARNLRGHLLLIQGALDDNTPPYLTLLVVDALIKANRDFDLIMVPDGLHGPSVEGSAAPYLKRRRWDYFVRHLLGVEPPAGVDLRPPAASWREDSRRAVSLWP